MKKINKYMSLAAVAVIGAGMLVSCDTTKDNDFVAEYEGSDAGGVYIPTSANTNFEVNNDQTQYSFPLLHRGQAKGELTVPVTITGIGSNNVEGAFTFGSTVTFADGELIGPITVTCDPSMLSMEVVQEFNIVIDEAFTTVYGPDEAVFTITLPSTWTSIGKGTYVDEYWGVNPYSYYTEVEFFKNDVLANVYRIKNPYTWISDGDEYLRFRVLQPGDTYYGVTVTNNMAGYVGFDACLIDYSTYYNTGLYLLFPAAATDFEDPYYWKWNFVAEYQNNGMPAEIHLSPLYYFDGVGYYPYYSSEFISIFFPGIDYIRAGVSLDYNGTTVTTDGQYQAIASVQLEPDAAFARVAVFPGPLVQEDLEAIVFGTCDYRQTDIDAELYLDFTPDTGGVYTIVAVSYLNDEDGVPRSYDFAYVPFSFVPGSWTELTDGTYTYLDIWAQNFNMSPETLTLYQSDWFPEIYRITHWFFDQPFDFTMDETGNIIVANQYTGYNDPMYGKMYVDDTVSYTGDTELGYSYIRNGNYYFSVIYYDSDGVWSYGTETFTTGNTRPRAAEKSASLQQALENRAAGKRLDIPRAQKFETNLKESKKPVKKDLDNTPLVPFQR